MRINNRLGKNGFSILIGFWIVGVCLSLGTTFWVVPSIVTSGIKAVSEKCGTAYPVEVIWNGNLFCGDPIVPEDK